MFALLLGAEDAGTYDAKREFAAKFDEKSLEVIRNAKSIELIRLQNDASDEQRTALRDGGSETIDEYVVSRRFVITDPHFVARFKKLTLNPASYRWYGGAKWCGGFQPKVVLRFGEDALHSVDVFLCFNCDDIAVRGYGKASIGDVSAENIYANMETEEWLRLVQSALPNDEFIQKQLMHGERRKPPPANAYEYE